MLHFMDEMSVITLQLSFHFSALQQNIQFTLHLVAQQIS